MLIIAEATPNPEALTFRPQMRLTDGRGWSFTRERAAACASPLADALLALAGVGRVYIGEDFVTVIRQADSEPWSRLRIEVTHVIAEVLGGGTPAVEPAAADAGDDDTLEAEVRAVLDRHVRPAVARDGGDVILERLDPAGVAWIRLEGACGGCPSSRRTLKDTVERTLRHYVPEVTAVAEASAAGDPEPTVRKPRWLQWRVPRSGPRAPTFHHNGRPFRN